MGRNLDTKATAILLAEACFFDDEKKRLAAKSAERATQKHATEVQLQPGTVKCSCNNNSSRQNVQVSIAAGTTTTTDRQKINPEMDNFINAKCYDLDPLLPFSHDRALVSHAYLPSDSFLS